MTAASNAVFVIVPAGTAAVVAPGSRLPGDLAAAEIWIYNVSKVASNADHIYG